MLIDNKTAEQLVQDLNDLGLQLSGAEGLITDGKHVLCARKIQAARTKHMNILILLDNILNPKSEIDTKSKNASINSCCQEKGVSRQKTECANSKK